MYNWKKRLLAAVLAGCMTVGLMAPALATVGGEDTASTAVDPGFSVDPVYPVEPTDPVEPVEPTPPVETEIPDGEIPLDPGFGMHDWANMSAEELYEVVKDLSDEDRAIVYSLLTEEQIAALEEYEKAMELPEVDMEAAQALLDELSAIDPMASDFVIRDYLLTLTEEEWALLELVLQPEEVENLRSYLSLSEIEVEEDTSEAPPFTSVGPLLPDGGTSFSEATMNEQPMQRMARTMASMEPRGGNYVEPAEGLLVNKTVSAVEGNPNRFVINMTAEAESNIVETSAPCDIVLVLDVSGSMAGNKLTDLKNAVNGFLDTILQNSPDSRVSIVSYSNGANVNAYLTDISDGIDGLKGVVNNLSAGGGTYSNKGLEQAYYVLNGISSSDPMYDNSRAVVLFTDGIPGSGSWSGLFGVGEDAETHECAQSSIYWGQVLKAPKGSPVNVDAADSFYGHHGMDFVTRDWLWESYKLRDNRKNMPGCGATVYTVGLGLPQNDVKINEYMYRTSSSRPDGTHVVEWGNGGYYDNRTRNIPDGYYLTTDNSGELNDIFEKIANQTGRPIEGIKIRDYISPQFNIVDTEGNVLGVGDTFTQGGYIGTIGEDDNGLYIEWTDVNLKPMEPGKPETAQKFNESIYVEPKSGFLGGNSVPTNIADISGVYDTDGDCIGSFPEPKVDVAIQPLTLNGNNVNIYYGNDAPAPEDLVSWGGTPLSQLESWQTAYVNVSATVTNTINNTTDGSYDVAVTVTPKSEACGIGTPAVEQTDSAQGTVNVFKLYVTYQDTTVTQGETSDYADNLVDQVWKHGDATDENVAMMGSRPTLSFAYDPEDGEVIGTGDINVKVAVTKDGTPYGGVVFVWQSGNGCAGCTDPNPDAQFRIHIFVPEFTFTLTKELANGETADGEQTFMFNITDGTLNMTVALTIPDGGTSASKQITLPSGTYTVTEDSDWSWKYEKNNQSFEVTKDGDTAEFTNTRNDKNWLGGSHSVENHFAPVSGSSAGTIDTLDALVPPLPTGEKKQENEDDQKKTEPDPGEDPDLDGMTQEGGVDHV